ncbi:hypothetical protein JOF29_004037 [Kribbella aluminosa]|uniref:Bacterial repeat domain-containing protein n=1 Tax=Kribbella aluminosa TaxID=416017 RepID=A0ABS4UMW2_9ACTN|nr:hypothetical protein [Kribbella aluminosa]MBP2352954.1 hypothetical protein [Kribbella aluminosa]
MPIEHDFWRFYRPLLRPGTYEVGAQVTVTAAPRSDSVFRDWTVNGAVVATTPSYIFTVTTDQILTANFTPK